jgi:vacuolar-type H+-ATPase subunit I/STV1
MAIILGFKEFRHYLMGSMHKIKVFTDHKNIAYFATTKELNKRQIRWAEYLSEFDYVIIHKKGLENGRADALSRRSDYDTGEKIASGQILHLNDEGHYEQRSLNAITYKIEPDLDSWNKIIQASEELKELPEEVQKGTPPTYNNKIWIPPKLRDELLKELHAHPTAGHQGIRRTLERIRRSYDYKGIKKDVTRVV